jgi:hypothetical protein
MNDQAVLAPKRVPASALDFLEEQDKMLQVLSDKLSFLNEKLSPVMVNQNAPTSGRIQEDSPMNLSLMAKKAKDNFL